MRTLVVVPTAILHENRASPPPMMTAMADTATGLQMGGLRTTKARIGSVTAKDAFIWGQSTPVKQIGMFTHACHAWASWSLMRQLLLKTCCIRFVQDPVRGQWTQITTYSTGYLHRGL